MGKLTQFVTFQVELLLMTATTWATILFLSHYFNSTLKIPPLVFMFIDAVSIMAAVTVVAQMFVFSSHKTRSTGDTGDTNLSQVCQGFAVVSSVMWVGLILLMFIDVPRITSIPGYEPPASLTAVGMVIGFSIFIPLLALVVCYTALPVDGSNSLLFNGSTIGVFSLLFFVMVSFGNGGVLKCEPFAGVLTGIIFNVFVWTYHILLYLIEIMNFYRWNPFKWLMSSGEDGINANPADSVDASNTFLGGFRFDFWRIPGAALNGVIILSTLAFSSSAVHGTVVIVCVAVLCMHIPLVISRKIDADGMQQDSGKDAQYNGYDPMYPNPYEAQMPFNGRGELAEDAYQGQNNGQNDMVSGVTPFNAANSPQYSQSPTPFNAANSPQYSQSPFPVGVGIPTHSMYPAKSRYSGPPPPNTNTFFGLDRSYGDTLPMRLNTGTMNSTIPGIGSKSTTSLPRQRRHGAN
jgi:hypothetical protein